VGGKMKQQVVHQYVIGEITGLNAIQPELRKHVRLGGLVAMSATAIVIVSCLIWDQELSSALALSIGILLAAIPFARVLLEILIRQNLRQKNLKIQRVFIGNKEYLVPDNGVLDSELGLFAVASKVISGSGHIWHGHSVIESNPSVGLSVGTFGPDNRKYAFIYGSVDDVMPHVNDRWDMDHVRKFTATDAKQIKKQLSAWKRKSLTPVAIGYAPLANDDDINDFKINELTLLGLVGLHGTGERGSTYAFNPAQTLLNVSVASLQSTIAISVLAVISYFGLIILSIPLSIGVLQIIVLSLLFESALFASQAWDHDKVQNKTPNSKLTSEAVQAGLIIASLAYTNYLLFFSRRGIAVTDIVSNSVAHHGAMALTLLTIGICIILFVLTNRKFNMKSYNPLFLLGLSSSVLVLILATYATGPVDASDMLFSGVAGLAFVGIRYLIQYSDTHHTRDQILELLRSS
jgi:hypothetical protein